MEGCDGLADRRGSWLFWCRLSGHLDNGRGEKMLSRVKRVSASLIDNLCYAKILIHCET